MGCDEKKQDSQGNGALHYYIMAEKIKKLAQKISRDPYSLFSNTPSDLMVPPSNNNVKGKPMIPHFLVDHNY